MGRDHESELQQLPRHVLHAEIEAGLTFVRIADTVPQRRTAGGGGCDGQGHADLRGDRAVDAGSHHRGATPSHGRGGTE